MTVAQSSQLRDAVWPDPYGHDEDVDTGERSETAAAVAERRIPHQHPLRVDDVSRLSATPVQRVFFPRSEEDVVAILEFAVKTRSQIAVRGTQHSMGGHCMAKNGILIDTKCLHLMRLDSTASRATCGPGCRWSDLIFFLNQVGRSPRTMQSYCSFSVGGTLAVNAHGITTDFCFAESVTSFRLVVVNGDDSVEVLTCARESSDSRSRDLFSLALGGFGLFGVITEVTLKVVENATLEMDAMQLSTRASSAVSSTQTALASEFERIYHETRSWTPTATSPASTPRDEQEFLPVDFPSPGVGAVEMKLARLNILNCDSASLYIFRRGDAGATISSLPLAPRRLTPWKRILYKWVAPAGKELRYLLEGQTGTAVDWSLDEGASRNDLLFESADDLARLYEPLFVADDTFILQEFFVPAQAFQAWIDSARPIFADIDARESESGVILLNCTIRFVEEDKDTVLAYSRFPGGCFAFVLYYRLPRQPRSVESEVLAEYHRRFLTCTLNVHGSFYLPYRKCYSREEFKKAYPRAAEFAAMKEKHDPKAMFANAWFEAYVLPECSTRYQKEYGIIGSGHDVDRSRTESECGGGGFLRDVDAPLLFPAIRASWYLRSAADFPRAQQPDLIRRRYSSYRRLMQSKRLRRAFETQFLVRIFNVGDPGEIMREMGRACWDPANASDIEIFRHLRRQCAIAGDDETSSRNPVTTALQNWKALRQGARQKQELVRQLASVFTRLGGSSRRSRSKNSNRKNDEKIEIDGYVSIGDHGKLVLQMREHFRITGRVYVCHDAVNMPSCSGSGVLPAIIERGSLTLVGQPVHFDLFQRADWARDIPDASVDLVTMSQGLHHIPPDERLLAFLQEVLRVLRPGGWFVFREHNLVLIPESGSGPRPRASSCTTTSRTAKRRNKNEPCLEQPPGVGVEMLDLAHSVFNAVTGVAEEHEVREIRAFRPVREWRDICTNVGFEDAMLFEIEPGDCTWDEMLLFCKPQLEKEPDAKVDQPDAKAKLNTACSTYDVATAELPPPPVVDIIKTILGQVPASVAKNLACVLATIGEEVLPAIGRSFEKLLAKDVLPKQFAEKAGPAFANFLATSGRAIQRVRQMLEKVKVREVLQIGDDVLPNELFLIVPYLQWREKTSLQAEAGAAAPDGSSSPPSPSAVGDKIGGQQLGDLERMALQACRDYLPFLLLPEADISAAVDRSNGRSVPQPLPEPEAQKPQQEKQHQEEQRNPHVALTGDINPTRPISAWGDKGLGENTPSRSRERGERKKLGPDEEVTAEMVYQELLRLDAEKPGLLKPETLSRTGFTVRQQTALVTKFGGKDLRQAAENLAWYLTPSVWNEMLEAIDEVCQLQDHYSSCDAIVVPTKERLFGETVPVHPWHRVLFAFLKSPQVRFTATGKMGVRMVGLTELVSLWELAQEKRAEDEEAEKKATGQDGNPISPDVLEAQRKVTAQAAALASASGNELRRLASRVLATAQKKRPRTKEFLFGATGGTTTGRTASTTSEVVQIANVGSILQAEFGYTSLTSRPANITKALRQLYEQQLQSQSNVHVNREQGQASNRKRNTNGQNVQDTRPLQLGTLTVDKETLKRLRWQDSAQGQAEQAMDSGRKMFVQAITLGQAGQNKLVVTYLPMIEDEEHSSKNGNKAAAARTGTSTFLSQGRRARDVCARLRALNLARTLHKQPEYTWYKLCEWLQVDMMEVLVSSLSHTPWFRFPFTDFVRMYFDVLSKEAGIVEESYGFWTAYTSTAFFTDLIPGVVMGGLFAQLALLAKPLRMLTPEEGYQGFDQQNFREQAVLLCTKIDTVSGASSSLFSSRPDQDQLLEEKIASERFWKEIDPVQIKTVDVVDLGCTSMQPETAVDSGKNRNPQERQEIVILETLPFKALGEVLEKIALRVPDCAQVLEISGQQEVQVRVSVQDLKNQEEPVQRSNANTAEQLGDDAPARKKVCVERLADIPGCEIAFEYEYPQVGDVKLPLQVALKVQCCAILELLRTCRLLNTAEVAVVVEQVYDFWGGDN
ncbi:unnamed protein product [Amoebophrya sp. A120]|nr:unnamed protein product [Amoebophrya sp. A120]|eukprot:GSA120T00012928001.1